MNLSIITTQDKNMTFLCYRKLIKYKGSKLWNTLPTDIREKYFLKVLIQE